MEQEHKQIPSSSFTSRLAPYDLKVTGSSPPHPDNKKSAVGSGSHGTKGSTGESGAGICVA
ncbi:hypothetical protein E2C01_097305 [Portunus trituberculatus]|uniref:Uncharacterized protein n=1 Tax=Portunus trituberculatus TaxID=210409 RepID=A0A5B7JUU4_PORTR|nr:hypothetical protein [Portunus trituberculatus]